MESSQESGIPPESGGSEHLESHRGYLRLLAQAELNVRLQAKVDASDVVQQTLLEAHRDRDKFQGKTDRERLAWLRAILANNIANVYRQYNAKKRDVALEVALDDALDDSAVRLENWLAAQTESPSETAVRVERVLQLAAILTRLPREQQDVLTLHYCQDWPLEQIGKRLDKTPSAVAAIAYRGIRKLREMLREESL